MKMKNRILAIIQFKICEFIINAKARIFGIKNRFTENRTTIKNIKWRYLGEGKEGYTYTFYINYMAYKITKEFWENSYTGKEMMEYSITKYCNEDNILFFATKQTLYKYTELVKRCIDLAISPRRKEEDEWKTERELQKESKERLEFCKQLRTIKV